MTEKRTFRLAHETARSRAIEAVESAPDGTVVTLQPATRSLDQNAAQWPYLEAFSRQLQWPVNGAACTLSPDEWKDILSAAFQREHVRLAMGMDGGVVMLGLRTSKMSRVHFSEWLEFLKATAALRGVTVYDTDPA